MTAAPLHAAALAGDLEKDINEKFVWELTCFIVGRDVVRRLMATPDSFPLVCELVEAAKKYYASLPRQQRNNIKHIPFACFGRQWLLRTEYGRLLGTDERYLNICFAHSRTVLVTVPVQVVESWDMP